MSIQLELKDPLLRCHNHVAGKLGLVLHHWAAIVLTTQYLAFPRTSDPKEQGGHSNVYDPVQEIILSLYHSMLVTYANNVEND